MQLIERHKEDELEEYLNHGEELIWHGMPKQGILFSSFDFFMIPFSLLC